IKLNVTGQSQASRNGRVLAQALGGAAAALGYMASPLVRARETMEIIRAELALPRQGYRTDDRLRELDYGHWEGRRWQDLVHLDPDGTAARLADPWNWQPAGGESYAMLSQRVGLWLADVQRDAVVVAHGGVSRVLRGLVLRLTAAETMRLEVPQDKVLVLASGAVRWL
ncbi:MAG: histidine phosphatase family protein, partial [Hyphomicrobiaceae bacterium]|nr:histidine phosphatase family protein [Hyphomicrobiaceae bacterium]